MNEIMSVLKEKYHKYSKLIKLIFLFSILLFVINQMTGILQGMTWPELRGVLTSQSASTLLVMSLVSLVAVLPMLRYDRTTVAILVEHGKAPISTRDLFMAAWITNTINNLAGFGGVIGATLRGRFYGSESDTKKVVTTVSKIALFMLSGLSLLCLLTFVDVFFIRPSNPFRNYWIWLLGGSLYAPALLLFTRLRRQQMFADFPLKRVLQLMLGSLGQWLGALTTFLVIGALLKVDVHLSVVYPLFVVATFIGMISMVPGGMGTFDVLMILGLAQLGLPKEVALGWLLFYRLFYYVLPFLTGIGAYLHLTGSKINDFFDGLPELLGQRLAHYALVAMVYFAGLTMVLLATVPNLSNLSAIFQKILPFSFNFLDQTLNMLVGFLLLGLARGVSNRVQKAYLPTLALLAFCILNTVTRSVSWKLLVFYAFLIICLYGARKQFSRIQLTFTIGALAFDSLLYGGLFMLYSVVGFYSSDRVQHGAVPAEFLLFPSETVWLQGFIGLVLAAITIFMLYRYLGSRVLPGTPFESQRVGHMLATYPGTHLSHLVYLKNKRHYFYQEDGWDQLMFTFEIQGSNLFVLGDPIGKAKKRAAASRAFFDYGDKRGYQLVFYGISAEYALLLHDLGFEFIKLGEEGLVSFDSQRLGQGSLAEHQLMTQRLLNQGYQFRVYDAPLSEEIMVELEKVSDEWQTTHKERYFSMGQFDEAYLNQAPVGVVSNSEREIIAFISLKPISEASLSYDLLRFKQTAPPDIRLFLVTSLLDYAQEQELSRFKIGFAPFANVGESEGSFFKERLIHALYKYSYPFYDFQEVREFKENFATKWQPYYLSYRKQNHILFIMLQLYWLVGRGSSRRLTPVESLRNEERSSRPQD